MDSVIKIQLDGSNNTFGNGIVMSSHSNTVKGLSISGFAMAINWNVGPLTNNRIQGSYLGVEADGTTANVGSGIETIKTSVSDSYIGTDGDGSGDTAERNIIGTSDADATLINIFGGNNLTIAGNYIGVGIDGSTNIAGSNGTGINTSSSNHIIGTNGDGTSDNIEGNVISGHNVGISLNQNSHVVAGNIIGLNATGNAAIPNATGIYSTGNLSRIGTDGNGTSDSSERNIISGNTGVGISYASSTTGARVSGNYIGVGSDGTTDLGNLSHGVYLSAGSDSTIGGDSAAEGNIIAYNGDGASEYGIYLTGAAVDQNRILRNSIFSNENEGIKLAFDGANDNQVAPAIITNEANGSDQNIIGTTEASGLVQLFDASADSEGETYLGEDTSDSNGTWTVTVSAPYTTAGNTLVATATSTVDNTSQFSVSYSQLAVLDPYLVTNADSTGDGSLRWAMINAVSAGGNVTISFDITSCYNSTCLIQPAINLPNLSADNIIIDGYTQSGAQANTVDFPNPMTGTLKVQIDGSENAAGSGFVFTSTASGNVIKGLSITGFTTGIEFAGGLSDNKIQGNYIGVGLDGTTTVGNSAYGILIANNSGSIIGIDGDGTNEAEERNVIGNSDGNIFIQSTATSITVAGNYIGLFFFCKHNT
ncbi:hypothetical protein BVY02_01750, partial [bacterium J17]